MLKKIFLSCLTAAIVLPLPLGVKAATSNINRLSTISSPNLLIAGKSLSIADQASIKKEIMELMKAVNAGNAKKFLSHYSKKYQSQNSNGSVSTYTDLEQNAEAGLSVMKAFGTKFSPEDIRVGTNNGKVVALVTYKVDLSKGSPLANTPNSERNENQQYSVLVTFEKVGGRWLILSNERVSMPQAPSVATANDRKTVTPITSQDKQTFSNLFKRHLDALNRKNLNDYLATLDPKAPQYNQTKQETAQLFKEYTLKYTIKSVKVLSINKQEAVVEMVATVKKISGGGFKDSQMTTTNLLKKTNGKWRIYNTSINSLTDLQANK